VTWLRFPQAHTAEQDEVGFVFDKLEVEVLLHLEAVDPCGPVPAELLQGFDDGEARQTNATFGGTIPPQVGLAFNKSGQIVHMGPRFVRCLFGQLCILSGDKGELQIGEMVLHVAQ
jgi:hypothetical protein